MNAEERINLNVHYLEARLDEPERSLDRMFGWLRDGGAPTGIQICALAFIAEHAPREQSVRAAVQALRASFSGLRREAIRLLGQLRAREALSDLCVLSRQVEGEAALCLARSLGQIGGQEVEPGLLELLGLPDVAVKRLATEGLERFGSQKALGALHAAASSRPRTRALSRAIERARAQILRRSFGVHPDRGRLSDACLVEERGQLSEPPDRGELSVAEDPGPRRIQPRIPTLR